MPAWLACPCDPAPFQRTPDDLREHWHHLHAGDGESWPGDPRLQAAWALFHAGAFEPACQAALALGLAGLSLANKAQAIQANYLTPSASERLSMLLEVVERAGHHQQSEPDCANAWFWQAYALGRYAQEISVARAMAQGLGAQVEAALHRTLQLAPRHADAQLALGLFHAEVIDKIGPRLGPQQGGDRDEGLRLLRAGLAANPGSAIAKMECADGLVMLLGDAAIGEADRLYAEAAQCEPRDAKEWLDVQRARAALQD